MLGERITIDLFRPQNQGKTILKYKAIAPNGHTNSPKWHIYINNKSTVPGVVLYLLTPELNLYVRQYVPTYKIIRDVTACYMYSDLRSAVCCTNNAVLLLLLCVVPEASELAGREQVSFIDSVYQLFRR